MRTRQRFIYNKKTAMSLVEILISVAIASFVMLFVFKFSSRILFNFQHGFVSLQNFQDAHIAINYLRRDFSVSCPHITNKAGVGELKKFISKPFCINNTGKFLGQNNQIQITPQNLIFYKYAYPNKGFSTHKSPLIEEVKYDFNKTKATLTRSSGGRKQVFKGFKNVQFGLYVHEANKDVPVLHVKFLIDSDTSKSSHFGKPLEITTSIASNFIADSVNHNGWSYRTYHRLK